MATSGSGSNGPVVPFKLWYGVAASGTGVASITGLPFTPDWVLFGPPSVPNALSWSATSTTLTLTGRSVTTAMTVPYICGNYS